MSKKTYDFSALLKIFHYAKSYRFILILVTISAILSSLFSVARPYFLQFAIDKGIFVKDYEKLIYYGSMMLMVLFFEVISQILFVYYSGWLGEHVIANIRTQLFEKIVHFRMQYFDKSSVGTLVTRTVNDIQKISEIFSQGLFMIISDVLKMIVITVFMFSKHWQLSLLVFSIFPLTMGATKWFHKKVKDTFEKVRNEVANLNTFVQEHISGMKVVQNFASEDIEFKKFNTINQRHRDAWLKTILYYSIFFPITEILNSITLGLLVWYGGLQSVENSGLSIGIVITFIQLTQMLFKPLRQIADKFNTLQMGMVAAKRVFEVLDTPNTLIENTSKELTKVQGNIKFTDVEFSYIEGEKVLDKISFEAKKGETIAIVGATGAGKSTIVKLLNRFYDIDKGKIEIDNTDIYQVSLKNLREHISVVLQDVFLFADSILNNIRINDTSISREQVIKAAKEIGVHQFIMSLPDNYDYNVKERGAILSSGQRQLISFLRSYLANPSILVLDEATSSIDSNTEQLIQKATEKITKNRTSIIIAHRLATIQNADRILVMEKGKIVETGKHEELIQHRNGFYKRLYDAQFGESGK